MSHITAPTRVRDPPAFAPKLITEIPIRRRKKEVVNPVMLKAVCIVFLPNTILRNIGRRALINPIWDIEMAISCQLIF
jgi:hypothetical protein